MTVAELLKESKIRPYPPFNEKHVEISRTRCPKDEQQSFILTEQEAVERFGDREVWLAFHAEGTLDKPVGGEHVFCICIDKNGWKENQA